MDEAKKSDDRPVLDEAGILEVFQKLQLSSAADRERFLSLEKLGEATEGADDPPFSIRFGNSTQPISA